MKLEFYVRTKSAPVSNWKFQGFFPFRALCIYFAHLQILFGFWWCVVEKSIWFIHSVHSTHMCPINKYKFQTKCWISDYDYGNGLKIPFDFAHVFWIFCEILALKSSHSPKWKYESMAKRASKLKTRFPIISLVAEEQTVEFDEIHENEGFHEIIAVLQNSYIVLQSSQIGFVTKTFVSTLWSWIFTRKQAYNENVNGWNWTESQSEAIWNWR